MKFLLDNFVSERRANRNGALEFKVSCGMGIATLLPMNGKGNQMDEMKEQLAQDVELISLLLSGGESVAESF